MDSWFAFLTPTDRFFLLCAAVGSVGVLLRLASQFLGFASGSLDGDADLSGDASTDIHDAFDGFKIISIHGLAAFFMMFGLVGFAMRRESQAGIFISVFFGAIAGAASVWVIAKLFKMAARLQSVGNLDIAKAVGCTGTVYLKIPKGSSGRVVVNVGGRQREMDAVHVGGEEIATGVPIVVVRLDDSIAVIDIVKPMDE
jgi:membrane protein implicated in regulation of membrane protease activity